MTPAMKKSGVVWKTWFRIVWNAKSCATAAATASTANAIQPCGLPPCRSAGMLIAVAAIPTANRKIFAWSGRPGAGAVGASIRSDIPLARVLLHRLSPDFVVHAYPPASWFLSLPDRRPPRGAPGRPPRAAPGKRPPRCAPGRAPCASPRGAPGRARRRRDAVVAPPHDAVPDAAPRVAPPRRSPGGAPGLAGRRPAPAVALPPDGVAPGLGVEGRPSRRVLSHEAVERGIRIDRVLDRRGRGGGELAGADRAVGCAGRDRLCRLHQRALDVVRRPERMACEDLRCCTRDDGGRERRAGEPPVARRDDVPRILGCQ